MSEQNHSSSKIMWATIGAAVLLMAIVVPFTIKGNMSAATGNTDNTDARIQPVARVELQLAGAAGDGQPKDGATVYNTVCGACHASGALNAPKAGDKAAWGPRIGQGKDALYKSALNGKNAMPARGGASSLSDAEVKAAVDHLIGLAK